MIGSDKSIEGDAIALLIPSLQVGGAEHQLLELANGLIARGRPAIIVTYGEAALSVSQNTSKSAVRVLRVRKTANLLRFVLRLRDLLRREQVGVLHAYLKSAQAYAVLLKLIGWEGALVFGVRDSLPLFHQKDLKNLICDLVAFNRVVGPDVYIFNSRAGLLSKGLQPSETRTVVIGNSVNPVKFNPGRKTSRLRSAIGATPDESVVGIVANASRHKDYPTFIRAAARILDHTKAVRFVSIGNVDTPDGAAAVALVDRHGIRDRFVFLGPRSDIGELLPDFDVLCSSSVTEGFSNVIAEAMACGVPCVVTDVGDSAHIIGETGKLVPARDPERLARAVNEFLRAGSAARREVGVRARARAIQQFSPDAVVSRHLAVYDSLLRQRRNG